MREILLLLPILIIILVLILFFPIILLVSLFERGDKLTEEEKEKLRWRGYL